MFARDGSVWTDDPYNFNISDSLGGNDSKKKSSRNETAGGELGASRSKQTRIAKKHSLSKSIIKESSLRSMSLKHQESAELSKANSTAVIDSDATRRKSIPATTASALDKAMGFLQKYKKEGASTPTTSLGTQQTSTNRRWSAANASSDEEDGMDISLGSDGDEISRNVTQRTKSRLKPNRIPPAPEPSRRKESAHEGVHFGVNRSLTDVPPSDHFATARDLGITATEGLDRPKTSVSPVGLDRCKARYDIEGFGIGHETDTCLAQEGRTSGLRFSVSIPGSPSSDVVRQVQGDDSDCVSSVKSITSAVVEDIQPEEHDERRTRRISSLDLAGSGEIDLERRSGPIGTELGRGGDRSMNQREDDSLDITTEADDRMFERIHAGSDFGKLSLFDDGDTSVDPGHHQALIPGHTTTMTETRSKDHGEIKDDLRKMAPADAKDDDSYEDDDFEDVVDDSLESSERDLDDGEAIRHEGDRHERDLSPAIGAIPIHDGDEERTSGWKQEAASEVQPPSEGIHSREHLSFDETRQAWDQGTRARSPNLTTTIKGNNPDNDHEAPATSNASNSAQAHLPTTKESWVVKGRKAVPSSPTNETTIATQCIAGNSSRKQALVGGGLGGVEQVVASAGGVSKRGVRIDRSAEMLSPQRPPNSAIKILRSNAVASVEFAHDPDRGLDLRSIGTQAIGNTAAVQASIVSPGMRGTESVLDDGLEARGVRTPGVGYRTGESYAIWGRFACEAPASRLGGRYYEWDQGATATSSSSHCRPQSLDREMMAGEGLGAAGSVPETISDSDESTTTRGGGKVDGQSTARIPARSDDFDAPGIPSYLQVFLGAMAKSQEESCAAWTKALEETVETRGSHPSLALEASFQSIRRCVSSQPLKSYVALNKLPTPTPYRLPAEGPVEGGPSEKTKGLCDRGDADAMGGYANEIWRQSSGEIDTADVNGMVLATEDSFRQQLADLRRNLNEIRHRAEGATCSGYKTYKYETLADARNFIARVRPSATSYAEALRTVDPSLTPKEATALADGHDHEAIPSSPTEPCTTTDRAKEGAGD